MKQAGKDDEAIDALLENLSWSVLPNLVSTAVDIERKSLGLGRDMLTVSLDASEQKDIELSLSVKQKNFLEKLKPDTSAIATGEKSE